MAAARRVVWHLTRTPHIDIMQIVEGPMHLRKVEGTAMNPRLVVLMSLVAAFSLLVATGSRTEEPVRAEKPDADPMVGNKSGQVRDDNGLKMKLVWCRPGFVTMELIEIIEEPGTTDEDDDAVPENRRVEKITPVKVLLTRGFWLGKYEITQAEWKQVMATEPWKGQKYTKDGDDFPATSVSWIDAMEFCRKLTQQERAAGRLPDAWEYTLPTEAQWERACRAHTDTTFSFGDDESKLGEYAWFIGNAGDAGEHFFHAHRVGQKKPNPWGLHDMHGNACEWCRDWYERGKLPGGRDPEVKEAPERAWRVVRGGGRGDRADFCRSAHRNGNTPDERNVGIGFRVALSK
jgi:formylglycine-generating enzyme required for sulfatase activity